MARAKYSITRDNLEPPIHDTELALFTCAIQSSAVRTSLGALGVPVPDQFNIVHNTNPDDPPDIEALGLGWECTEFPPNQSALTHVFDKWSGPMNVPGFSQTGRDIGKMRAFADPEIDTINTFISVDKEIEALKQEFLNTIIGGPKSKDVSCNSVLLLDHRQQPLIDKAKSAITQALSQSQPKHIKLILLVAWHRIQSVDESLVPNVTVMYPFSRPHQAGSETRKTRSQ